MSHLPVRELAAELHGYYNATRILVDEETVKLARLALVAAVRQVLANRSGIAGCKRARKNVR